MDGIPLSFWQFLVWRTIVTFVEWKGTLGLCEALLQVSSQILGMDGLEYVAASGSPFEGLDLSDSRMDNAPSWPFQLRLLLMRLINSNFFGGQKSVGTNLKSGAIPKDAS